MLKGWTDWTSRPGWSQQLRGMAWGHGVVLFSPTAGNNRSTAGISGEGGAPAGRPWRLSGAQYGSAGASPSRPVPSDQPPLPAATLGAVAGEPGEVAVLTTAVEVAGTAQREAVADDIDAVRLQARL